MKKLILAAVGVVALATAGLAVARASDDGKTITSVTGTFAATTVANSQTRTCTTTDGKTIATTRATYSGQGSGAADFTGPVTLTATSTINTTDGVGVVDGRLRVTTSTGKTDAQLTAVYDHGNVAGLATGHGATHSTRLVANLSGAFTASGGFPSAKLGGTSGGSAVELGPGRCAPSQTVKESSSASGLVSAASSTSITVAGLTCSVSGSLAAKVAALKTGDRVEIRCSLVNGTNTLVKLTTKH